MKYVRVRWTEHGDATEFNCSDSDALNLAKGMATGGIVSVKQLSRADRKVVAEFHVRTETIRSLTVEPRP